MQTISEKHIHTLELPKILEQLSSLTAFETASELARTMRPATDRGKVLYELERTNHAYTLSLKYGAPTFTAVKNILSCLARSEAGSVLSPGELLSIAEVLRLCRSILSWKEHSQNQTGALDDFFSAVYPNKYLEDRITSCIISEEVISDHASEKLFSIRKRIRICEDQIRQKLEQITRSTATQKYLQEQLVTVREGRFVVPVKSEHKGDVPGLIHDVSGSGATLFVEPMAVVERNNEIKTLRRAEQEEIDRILSELSAECGSFKDSISESFEALTQLNVYFAKASLAIQMKATLPTVSDKGIIELKKARHPLIAADRVVPVDLELGKDFTVLVVTGPNTGGKTVSIKTLGLLTLMAMCGLFIPAKENSVVCVFEKVLADIGDEQSIEQSLSTFSSHMVNIIDILKEADEHSLVLLDELGAGTDPVEGAALAVSVIEDLRYSGARVAATTHYAEMKSYALQTGGVENASCEFDVETLRPTYKISMGIPGRSNAFAISQRLGIPERIITSAKQRVNTESTRFETVLEQLLKKEKEYEEKIQAAQQLEQEARKEKKKAEEQTELTKKEYRTQLENAKIQAEKMLSEVKGKAEFLLLELEKIKKDKEKGTVSTSSQNALRRQLDELSDSLNPVEAKKNANYVLPRPLKEGDNVLIFDIDKKGAVLSPVDAGGYVTVLAGIMKTRVPLSNLRLLEEEKVSVNGQGISKRNVRSNASAEVKSSVDLRGMTVEEALTELDRFIDRSVLSHVPVVTIVHGKGTGTLRSAISVHLRKHPSIRTFRLGVYGEGENGVTIAEIKDS